MTRRLFLFILLVCWYPAAALAEPGDAQAELGAWVVSPLHADVVRLYREHRVLLEFDPDVKWTDDEVASLRAGAAALPEAIVATLEEPLRVRRVHRSCLFGMGRYTKSCPTFAKDGAFLLYDVPPIQGEGPVMRLAPLDRAERRDIQRRRAIVHAVMARFDAELGWSEERAWRRINGWRNEIEAFNRDIWGYSRYLGSRAPRLDFLTFAEEFFVRPQDVTTRKLDPNLGVACQEFTKVRYLSEKIATLDPTWHPPARTDRSPDARCPEFEKWARFDQLEDIDILVASATADRPESLYGHLLLHVRYEGGSEGFEPVYQFGAVTDTNVGKIEYFSRGLLGGFLSVLEINSFRAVDRIFLQYEQRNLRRYRLNLSPRQKRRLMERIWEYERRVRYPYHFFANNCASFLIDLIGPALELDVPERSHFIVAPTDVLDFLAAVENGSRGSLLQKRPEVAYSTRELAYDAIQKRRDVMDAIVAQLEHAGPEDIDRLRRLEDELDDTDPDVRAAAYRELQDALVALVGRDATGASDPVTDDALHRLAIEYLYYCGQIERYFVEVAMYRARGIRARALEEPIVLTADEILARRRELFKTEDLDERYRTILAWSSELERRAREGPHREFTPEEREIFAREKRARAAYMAALEAQGTLIDTFEPELDAVAYLDRRHTAFRGEQARRDALATGPSGKGRLSLGGSSTSTDAQTIGGGVDGSFSFIYERLGEQRRRGFRSDVESRTVGIDLHVPVREGFQRELDVDVTLFRFLTIEQLLGPVRRNFLDTFGWGVDLAAGHDGRRGLMFEAEASLGLLYPIWTRDWVANYLVVGASPTLRVDFTDEGRLSMGGATAFLMAQFHLYGLYANVLRAKLSTGQFASVERPDWHYDVRGRLSTEHALFFVGQHPLVLSPYLLGEYTTLDFTGDGDGFLDLRAGVTIELPL